jgi:hypothetical protein
MEIICPKCNYKRRSDEDHGVPITNCPKCGIAYAKFDPRFEYLTPKPPVQPNTADIRHSETKTRGFSINIKLATLVADFFLGMAVILLIMLMILAAGGLFSNNSPLTWWMSSIIIGAITAEAWFGYVIKLLVGIYINTKSSGD